MLDYYAEVLLKYVDEELYLAANEEQRAAFEAEQDEKLSKKLTTIENREN